MVAVSYLQWAATVIVPLVAVLVPVVMSLRKLRSLDERNTQQHNTNTAVSAERFDRLEERLDTVLEVATDTNRQIADHLRDHFKGAA